jgi:Xaa-Pro aminopeptidase
VDNLFASRIIRLRAFLNRKEIQSILISNDLNIFYLTGFYGKDSNNLLLFVDDDIYLLVNFIYLEQAKKSIGNKKINIVCIRDDKYEKTAEILVDYNIKSAAVEGDNIIYKDFCRLEKVLSSQNKKLVDMSGAVEKLRLIKDQSEISIIKKACKINDKVFKRIIKSGACGIRGLSEIELAFKMEELMVREGSEGKSFDIIVAYGENSSMPHHNPQNKKSEDGLILMDFGCKYRNYCSDMTRTIFKMNNKNNDKYKKIYDIVLEAQRMAIESCREGVICSQLDAIVRDFIYSKGYGNNFGHGLGHGVGLEVHEEPKINTESEMVLKENMVITIEPGIYIKGLGGVRIEDMVLVGRERCELLYDSDKRFITLD